MICSIRCVPFTEGDVSRVTKRFTTIPCDYIYVSNANIAFQKKWKKALSPVTLGFVILAKQIVMSKMGPTL